MSQPQDEYTPAITMPTEPETNAASLPVAAAPEPTDGAVDAPDEGGPRGQRVVSDKVRAMFRDLASKVARGEVEAPSADDLVPMGQDDTPPTAARAPAAGAQSALASPGTPTQSQPAAPAAPLQLPALHLPQQQPPQQAAAGAAETQRQLLLEMREKEIEARMAQLSEREKTLPNRERLAEDPAGAIEVWLKDTFGIRDDGELNVLVSDVMSEISERRLGAKLPDTLRAELQSRKALRSVGAYKASLEADKKALQTQKEAQEKAAREEQAKREEAQRDQQSVAQVEGLLAPHRATYTFIHNSDVTEGLSPGTIVYAVYKEQKRQFEAGHTTQQPDLAAAAKFANDYYKNRAEKAVERASRLQTLLAPAAPAAPTVKPAISPGAAPGPAATTPAKTQQPADTDPSDLDVGMDRQERRRQSLAKMRARLLGGA